MAELTAALNALLVGVHEAAQGSGVQDTDLCKVLPNLDIVPGKLSDKAAPSTVLRRGQIWINTRRLASLGISMPRLIISSAI